jgi:hypothetical protein
VGAGSPSIAPCHDLCEGEEMKPALALVCLVALMNPLLAEEQKDELVTSCTDPKMGTCLENGLDMGLSRASCVAVEGVPSKQHCTQVGLLGSCVKLTHGIVTSTSFYYKGSLVSTADEVRKLCEDQGKTYVPVKKR